MIDAGRGAVVVPVRYPCSVMYVDESSAKQSGGNFFVVAAVKVRQPGMLARKMKEIRDTESYDGEFKFSRVSRGKLPVYYRLIDVLEESDAHIAACVVDRSRGVDPFKASEPEWKTHARITAKLLTGIMNRRELSSALLDHRSTPVGSAFDDTVRSMVNSRLKATGLVSAVCVDSASNDGIQVADLVAGAVALHSRAHATGEVNPNSHKAKVAGRLAAAFGVSELRDVRTERVNVMTHGSAAPNKLRSVGKITPTAG